MKYGFNSKREYEKFRSLRHSYQTKLERIAIQLPLIGYDITYMKRENKKLFVYLDQEGDEGTEKSDEEFVKKCYEENLRQCMNELALDFHIEVSYAGRSLTFESESIQSTAFVDAYRVILGREMIG